MRAFTIVSSLLFLALAAAHAARVAAEGVHVLADPIFAGTSLLALGMVTWGALLLSRSRR